MRLTDAGLSMNVTILVIIGSLMGVNFSAGSPLSLFLSLSFTSRLSARMIRGPRLLRLRQRARGSSGDTRGTGMLAISKALGAGIDWRSRSHSQASTRLMRVCESLRPYCNVSLTARVHRLSDSQDSGQQLYDPTTTPPTTLPRPRASSESRSRMVVACGLSGVAIAIVKTLKDRVT